MIKRHYFNYLAVILIVLLGVGAYGSSLKNGFVYDDSLVVKDNTFITSWSNLKDFFNVNYFIGSGELSYRPTITITYLLDYSLWKANPFGYHLTNLVLHIISGILLYIFLVTILPFIDNGFFSAEEKTRAYPIVSLLASLFFVSHPIQSESVDSVAFRPEVLYAVFLLLSLILYFKAAFLAKTKKFSLYVFSLACYFLALLSKEGALILIPFILLIDIFVSAKEESGGVFGVLKRRVAIYGWYLLVSAIYGIIRFSWMTSPALGHKLVSLGAIFHEGLYSRLITSVYIFVKYIKLLILPLNLTSEYMINFSESFFEPRIFSSALILAGITVLIFCGIRNFRILSFSGFWYFMTLLPAANFIPLHHAMAERYLYLPSMGFFLLLSVSLTKLFYFFCNRKFFKFLAVLLAGGIFLMLYLYCARSTNQSKMWHDESVFWNTVISKPGPHTARSYTNLGIVLTEESKLDEAIKRFRQALEVSPAYIQAYNNLGLVYYKKGDYDQAIENYQKILSVDAHLSDFDFIKVYSNLGVAYMAKNMPDKAIECYEKALELNPYLAEVYYNLGMVYAAKNMLDKAAENYQKSLELNPSLVNPYYTLGMIFLEKGLYDKAIERFERAIQISPGYIPPYYGLFLAYSKKGDYESARKYKEKCKSLGIQVSGNFFKEQ